MKVGFAKVADSRVFHLTTDLMRERVLHLMLSSLANLRARRRQACFPSEG